MLQLGILGAGSRARSIIKAMRNFAVPFTVCALVDPRAEQLQAEDPNLAEAHVYASPDAMLDEHELDGVMIGTRCSLHTPLAVKVAQRNLPLFLEKPVAITYEQLYELEAAFREYTSEVVVSFPLRLSPLVQYTKEVIDSGQLGTIEHAQAWNNVTYGSCYYGWWYRDWNETGGLFLQKATHDFDYLSYLFGQKPRWIAAMNSQRVFGGDKPEELVCADCDEWEDCLESPLNLYYRRGSRDQVYPDSAQQCMFSESIRNEDSGSALLEFENGAQACYSQNFVVRCHAGGRGARLIGYLGTIEFDWYKNHVKVFMHHSPRVETIEFDSLARMEHGGGDRELARDFLNVLQGKGHTRTPISSGILSALTCLKARESAATRQFLEVKM
jgi:predicted dehydrogenase